MSYFLGFDPIDNYTTLAIASFEVVVPAGESVYAKFGYGETTPDNLGYFLGWTLISDNYDEHGVYISSTWEGRFECKPLKCQSPTPYICSVEIYEVSTGTDIFSGGGTATFSTLQDLSEITNTIAINIKKKKVDLQVDTSIIAQKGRTDQYRLDLYYQQGRYGRIKTLPSITVSTHNISETISKIFNFTRLKENTRYYYTIYLINTDSDGEQIIDTAQGFFKTKGGFPLWMYLWYRQT